MNLTTKATMSSLEMVDFINSTREEGSAILAHSDFLKKVPLVLKGDEGNFSSIYLDSMNREKPCYKFPKREAMLMAMSYSCTLQAKVYDHMEKLEKALSLKSPTAPTQEPFALEIAQRNFSAAKILAEAFGLEGNAALLSADAVTKQITGISPMDILGITHLVKKVQERDLTPTEIGKLLVPEASARAVNLRLMQAGLQYKKGEVWFPTEEGSKYSVLLDTRKKHSDGTMIVQLKWNLSIKDLI